MKTPALVIVNLSTMDSYAERAGMQEAHALALRLKEAILSWEGPVYIIDQRWPRTEWSEPRWQMVLEVQLQRDIAWFFFDESRYKWSDFMSTFRARLIRDGVKDAVLGGLWYDEVHGAGEVAELAAFLKKHLHVSIDSDLVGTVSVAA